MKQRLTRAAALTALLLAIVMLGACAALPGGTPTPMDAAQTPAMTPEMTVAP